MFLNRLAESTIRASLELFPGVGLVGPRQCGKTTLAKIFSSKYFDLEQLEDQNRLVFQWDSLVQSKDLIILDEAQSFPEIFPKLRGAIDQDRKRMGRFLILGSVSPSIMKLVSESLSGRLRMIELTPLLLDEIPQKELDLLWLQGGFPDGGILGTPTFPVWQHSYLDLLIKRDLPLWGLSSKPIITQRLLKMLAASVGNLLNASQLGGSLGISHTSIQNYFEYLEGAFIAFKLMPYFANISKRIQKSPKIFFNDTGILHTLLDVNSYDKLMCQPWLGNSWENFVILQIASKINQMGLPGHLYFFRTSDGYEIDLILEGKQRMAIEIKTASTIHLEEIKRLKKISHMIGISKNVFIYRGNEVLEKEDCLITPLRPFLTRKAFFSNQ